MTKTRRAVRRALREAGHSNPSEETVDRVIELAANPSAIGMQVHQRADSLTNTEHVLDDLPTGTEHTWPAELDRDAACEVCGLEYTGFFADDPGCLSWPERRRREQDALWQTEDFE